MMKNRREAYADNPIMAFAFVGFISFAMKTDWMIDQFEKDTGLRAYWRERRAPIDAAIDKATGYEEMIADKYIDWLIANHWGENPFEGGDEE